MRRTLWVALAAIVFVGCLADVASAHGNRHHGAVIAREWLPKHGGTVRAHDGAALHVPSGVLKRRTLVTIRRLGHGMFDLHIHAKWSGHVEVTMPEYRRKVRVLHHVGRYWVPEGGRGQRTVVVSELSIFSWAKDKLKTAACMVKNFGKVLKCLAGKGIKKISATLAKWIAGLLGLDDKCTQSLIDNTNPFGVAFSAFVSGDCRQSAGESGFDVDAWDQQHAGGNTGGGGTSTGPGGNDTGGTDDGGGPTPGQGATVSLSQGPAASQGYRYAITLSGFPANSSQPITCYDSASPGGFYSFNLTTDGSGAASTAAYCYSNDGPDHWVTANGVESNHVPWGSGSSGGGGGAPPPAAASITASKGGYDRGGYDLNIAVHNFPTGTYTYECHDNSGPGGSDIVFYSHAVTVSDPNQSSWPAAFCYDSAPYVAYLVMNGVRSNGVQY